MAITPKIFKQMTKLIAGSMSAGRYDVRLAQSVEEIRAAQKLRYKVLFEASGGQISREMLNTGREEDEWDEIAYHVIVLDTKKDNKIVGTVRLVSHHALNPNQHFYTEHAFNIDGLLARYERSLELSRACVDESSRGGAILMLMWKFTMHFIVQNQYSVLFGCASFAGTDYAKHTDILSYLYHKHLADKQVMPTPKPEVSSIDIQQFQVPPAKGKKRGEVPTLLRGYLKIGAKISDHAIIDPVFNTTFVAIYVDVEQMLKTNHILVNKSF